MWQTYARISLACVMISALIVLLACDDDSERGVDDSDAGSAVTDVRPTASAAQEPCGDAIVNVLDGLVVNVDRASDAVTIEAGEPVVRGDGSDFDEGILFPALVYRADDGTLTTTGTACEEFPVPEPIR